MFAGSGNGKSRRRGRRGSARIIVPLAVPMALGLALGIAVAVSGGHPVTTLSESALGAGASPSASPSASPTATDTAAAPAANTDCELIVPPNPLSADGLATPYQLTGPGGQDPATSGCQQANPNLQAFVQATILDPLTGRLSVYEPLVVTQGSAPAAAP